MSEQAPEKKETGVRRFIKIMVKIIVTGLCFWYISTRIDFTDALKALTRAFWPSLAIAVVFFLLSKFFSALRLNIYFRNIGLLLTGWQNIKLYWLGMFYNLFLPGAISGDAYKVVLLNRRYGAGYKKTSAAVLLDRFSGVLALAVILAVYGCIILDNIKYDLMLLCSALLAFAGLYLAVRFLFKDFLPGFFATFIWGIAVQLCQVICIYCILHSLHISLSQHQWIFIFLASAVISILPLSLGGGLGTRELVSAEGARFFSLDPQTGVVISLLFYLITVAGSLPGLYYNFHDPLISRQRKMPA